MPEQDKEASIVRVTYTIVIPEMADFATIGIRRALEEVVAAYPNVRITASISHPLRRLEIE